MDGNTWYYFMFGENSVQFAKTQKEHRILYQKVWNKNHVQFAIRNFLYFNIQRSLLQYATLLIEYTGNTFSIYKKTMYKLYPPAV